mgnify:CR=1 FL=1
MAFHRASTGLAVTLHSSCTHIALTFHAPSTHLPRTSSQLYLNRLVDKDTTAVPPGGGKANLARIVMEIQALEGLLMRYRS